MSEIIEEPKPQPKKAPAKRGPKKKTQAEPEEVDFNAINNLLEECKIEIKKLEDELSCIQAEVAQILPLGLKLIPQVIEDEMAQINDDMDALLKKYRELEVLINH